MSIDILQEKIRKTKNPTVLELLLSPENMPPQYARDGSGYAQFCADLMEGLKGMIPAVRLSFASFSLLGHDGLYQLSETLKKAAAMGYYVFLDSPELLSSAVAERVADSVFGENTLYPCDGLVIGAYPGSDIIKPFLSYCKKEKKEIFVVARTANKSAPELQDLLTGTRLVHAAAVDHVNRSALNVLGKSGYSSVAVLTAASAADSLRNLRAKYPKLFFLVDGYDYPNSNAKNCSFAFDKLGHGAIVCSGEGITCAWKKAESDGTDYLQYAQAAADRMKKNLTRYITVL